MRADVARLFAPGRLPPEPPFVDGYLNLLGDDDPTGASAGQRLMVSRALPLIYERLWRPLGGRLLMGALGPNMAGERRIALEMLRIEPGDAVLDVGCGPGNFTRPFARAAGEQGRVVGSTRRARCSPRPHARTAPSSMCAGTPPTSRSATAASTRSAASPRST